jgi:hypothetical protein
MLKFSVIKYHMKSKRKPSPPGLRPSPKKKKSKDKTKRRKIWNSCGLSPAYYAKNAH